MMAVIDRTSFHSNQTISGSKLHQQASNFGGKLQQQASASFTGKLRSLLEFRTLQYVISTGCSKSYFGSIDHSESSSLVVFELA